MRIVGFGAHPDDVEIVMFGTLAAAQAAGAEVGWVIATDGSKGGERPADELRAVRREEAATAAAILGVTPVFLDRVDGELASDAEAASLVEDAVLRLKPDLVITHAPNDYHPDHRALSRLVSDGARFRVPVLFADTILGVAFQPSHYIDITAHFPAKLAAIRAHASQRPERFVAAAETWNRFRSMQCNAPDGYAEAFRFEPVYPFSDIRALLPSAPAVRPLTAVRRD
jgi:N-acetylglucosamine malate deacetylase 1